MSPKRAGRPQIKPSSYLSELALRFEAARRQAGRHDADVLIAGHRLRLRFAGEAMRDALLPAFPHIAADDAADPDMTIDVWDEETSGTRPPPIPWADDDVRELGQVRGFNEGSIRTVCDLRYGAITIVDLASRRAIFQVPAASRVRWYERAAPLRPALHWLLDAAGTGLVHAGAVGREGEGVLLAGRGGRGKSTLAAAAVLEGMECAGDDYVAVTLEPDPVAHAVHSTIKLSDDSLELLPLGEAVSIATSEEVEKNVIDLLGWRPQAIATRLRLQAIVVPLVVPGAARLNSIPAGQALLALAPSTMFQLPSRDGAVLRELAELARTVPAYELSLGDEPATAVGALEGVFNAVA